MRRLPYTLFALPLLLVQAGCRASVRQLRDQRNLHRGGLRQKLADKKEPAGKFLACTRQVHDERLSGRRDVGALTGPRSLPSSEGHAPSVRPLTAVIDTIRHRHANRGGSLSRLANMLDDVANDENVRIDFDKLNQLIEVASQWQGHIGLNEDPFERDPARFARRLLTDKKSLFWRSQLHGKTGLRWSRSPQDRQSDSERVRRSTRQRRAVSWDLRGA